MKPAEKEIILAYLGKTSMLPAETVASLFIKNGDDEDLSPKALEILLKEHADRVQANKEKEKTMFDNGFKKANSEIMPKLEKDLQEKYGIKSENKGMDLFEEIIALKTKAPELDDDKVKVHPVYTKAEKEAAKKLKDAEELWTKKFEEREKELARKDTLLDVRKDVVGYLGKIKPIYGTTEGKKIESQIDRLIMADLNQFDYVIQNGEKIVMKDGKRLEDDHGKPITLEALTKEIAAKHYDFEDGEARAGAGASNDGAAAAAATKGASGKVKFNGKLPKNESEYNKVFATIKDPAQRVALMEEFEASQNSTATV